MPLFAYFAFVLNMPCACVHDLCLWCACAAGVADAGGDGKDDTLVSACVSPLRALGGGGSSAVHWHRATGQEKESGGTRAQKQ